MPREVTDAQEDGIVVTSEGETVGTITRVEDGTAYVDPAADAPDTLTATLGWDAPERETGEGEYPLPQTAIDSVGEAEIRLQRGGGEIDRSDEDDPHEADADPAREGEERDAETDQEVDEAARNSEAEQAVENSIEREQAARNSANPNAHRDEEPFDG
jgi:hypothetical protein